MFLCDWTENSLLVLAGGLKVDWDSAQEALACRYSRTDPSPPLGFIQMELLLFCPTRRLIAFSSDEMK